MSIETREKFRVFSRMTILSRVIWPAEVSDTEQSGGSWTLLTGHGHVLVEITRNSEARIRDISAAVGLTERTVQAIVADLETAGYITLHRTGRRTEYTVRHDSRFRQPAQEGLRVGPFLACSPRPARLETPRQDRRTLKTGRPVRVKTPTYRRGWQARRWRA